MGLVETRPIAVTNLLPGMADPHVRQEIEWCYGVPSAGL